MAAQKNGEQLNLFRGIHGIANSIMAHKHASDRLKLAQQHEQLARDKFTHKQTQDKQAQENFNTKETNRMTIHKDNKDYKQKQLFEKQQARKDKNKQFGQKLAFEMAKNNRAQTERERHNKTMEGISAHNAKSYEAYTNSTIDRNNAQTNLTNAKTDILQQGNKRKTKNIKWTERVQNPHVQDAINKSNNYTKSNTADYGNIKR